MLNFDHSFPIAAQRNARHLNSMEQFPNEIKREYHSLELDSDNEEEVDKPINHPTRKIKVWQAVILFFLGIIVVSLKENIISTFGALGIMLSYGFLLLWVYGDFRMALGEKIWRHFGRRKSSGESRYGSDNSNRLIITDATYTDANCIETSNPLQPVKYRDILKHKCLIRELSDYRPAVSSRLSSGYFDDSRPSSQTSSCRSRSSFWPRRRSHTDGRCSIPSILLLYILMSESKWREVKRATKRNILHGHSARVLGVSAWVYSNFNHARYKVSPFKHSTSGQRLPENDIKTGVFIRKQEFLERLSNRKPSILPRLFPRLRSHHNKNPRRSHKQSVYSEID